METKCQETEANAKDKTCVAKSSSNLAEATESGVRLPSDSPVLRLSGQMSCAKGKGTNLTHKVSACKSVSAEASSSPAKVLKQTNKRKAAVRCTESPFIQQHGFGSDSDTEFDSEVFEENSETEHARGPGATRMALHGKVGAGSDHSRLRRTSQSQRLYEDRKKTKGRVKIKMEFIDNKLRRYTTFSKRKHGLMKKAYELSTLTGTQVMLLVASETGHVYTFATRKLQPMITSEAGKALIQTCLNSPDLPDVANAIDQRMNPDGFEERELSYAVMEEQQGADQPDHPSADESPTPDISEEDAAGLSLLADAAMVEKTPSSSATLVQNQTRHQLVNSPPSKQPKMSGTVADGISKEQSNVVYGLVPMSTAETTPSSSLLSDADLLKLSVLDVLKSLQTPSSTDPQSATGTPRFRLPFHTSLAPQHTPPAAQQGSSLSSIANSDTSNSSPAGTAESSGSIPAELSPNFPVSPAGMLLLYQTPSGLLLAHPNSPMTSSMPRFQSSPESMLYSLGSSSLNSRGNS